jgi:hypothetical protein
MASWRRLNYAPEMPIRHAGRAGDSRQPYHTQSRVSGQRTFRLSALGQQLPYYLLNGF